MTRQEIFYVVSLACLGLFILLGIYIWKGSAVTPGETEYIASQADDLADQGESKPQPQQESKGSGSDTAATTTANQATPTAPSAVSSSTPKNTASTTTLSAEQSQAPKATPTANNSIIVPGCKVGDIITLGDVEMVVTKATSTHKVIDITITGNTSGQPPKLVLVDQNRIIYEIPADVDINVDVTEKAAIEKSPLFNASQNKN